MKPRWLDRRALPRLPFLTLCLSEKEYLAALKHLGFKTPAPHWIGNAGARTHTFEHANGGGPCCVITIKIWPNSTYEWHAAALAHEAVHVWQAYRDDTLKEEKPSSELEAYVIQNITFELLTEFSRRLKQRNRRRG